MRRERAIAVVLALAAAVPAGAVPPLEAYGRLPSVDLIAMSPDGSRLAVAVTDGVTRQVQIRRLADFKSRSSTASMPAPSAWPAPPTFARC